MSTTSGAKSTPAHGFLPLLYTENSKKDAEDVCRLLGTYGFAVRKTETLRTEVYRDACRTGLILVLGDLQDAPMEQQMQLSAKDGKYSLCVMRAKQIHKAVAHTSRIC